MKKTCKIVVFLIFFLMLFRINSIASEKKDGIENFPVSYRPYLYELKKKHPNWQFTALYTNLDWNYVINEEYAKNKNLVPKSYQDTWKCMETGIYNVEIDTGWVNASKQAIEYTMDPRNFLNEIDIFQFEKLTYDPNVNSKDGIEQILYGTEFYNKIVTYKEANGTEVTTSAKYSDLIWDASVYSGVSPYHLASRIKQEVGPFLSHNSISGTVSGYEGLYNFYNIGATSSTEPLGAIKNGLRYAKDGKGSLSWEEMQNQLIPWNTKERAIKGGAVFIGKSYILVGQNTLYLQKFDVNDARSSSLFWHQYMTNCLASYSEAKSIYKAYLNNGMLNGSIGFVIPVYNNMPQYSTDSPNIASSDYEDDFAKVYANVTGNLNVRTGPSTSYQILTTVTSSDRFTRIKRGIQNGERWDKVVLENGMVGYVFQSYLREAPQVIPVNDISISKEEVNLLINDKLKLNASALPEDATSRELTWQSENESIASVTADGVVTAKAKGTTYIIVSTTDGLVQKKCRVNVIEIEEGVYVEFDPSLTIQGDEISNLNLDNLTVREVLGLVNTNMNLEILKYDDSKLEENEKIGTGSKLIIRNQDNQVIYQYKFILYGDVNGDGNINSLDVLVLQKHILEIRILKDEFLKAGNISRNGNLPSSLDVLKLQKHILEIKPIEQGDKIILTSIRMIEDNLENEVINEQIEDNNAINEENIIEEKKEVYDSVNNNITSEENNILNGEENNFNNENQGNNVIEENNIDRETQNNIDIDDTTNNGQNNVPNDELNRETNNNSNNEKNSRIIEENDKVSANSNVEE